jgi:hypothetical protein
MFTLILRGRSLRFFSTFLRLDNFTLFVDVPLKLLPLEFTKCLSSPLSRMRETNSICKRHKRSSQVALGFLKSSQIVNVHTAPPSIWNLFKSFRFEILEMSEIVSVWKIWRKKTVREEALKTNKFIFYNACSLIFV